MAKNRKKGIYVSTLGLILKLDTDAVNISTENFEWLKGCLLKSAKRIVIIEEFTTLKVIKNQLAK